MNNPKTVQLFALTLFLFLSIGGYAQAWQNHYPGTGGTTADVAATPDGGFFSSASGASVAFKTDGLGTPLWSVGLPDSIDTSRGSAVTLLPDGNYVVVGGAEITTPTNHRYVFAMKVSPAGGVIWTKFYPYTSVGTSGHTVAVAADGGLFIGTQYNLLMKTDADGNLLWQSTALDQSVRSLVASPDGGVVFIVNDFVIGGPVMIIRKRDANGGSVWQQSFTVPGAEYIGRAMAPTADGGFVLTGYLHNTQANTSDLLLQKFDGLGNLEWGQVVAQAGTEVGLGVNQTQDGGFVVTGWKTVPASRYVWVWRFGPTGNVLWEKAYFRGEGFDVQELPDGGFILLTTGLRLVRTDAQGVAFQNTIKGNIADDQNADCTFQAGEPGLAGWSVVADGPFNAVALSDANGDFEIPVDTGSYTVTHSPPQLVWQPCQTAQDVALAASPETADLGHLMAQGVSATTSTISGYVYQDLNGNCVQDPDEPGLAGCIVWAAEEQFFMDPQYLATTDENGFYSFTLSAGTDYFWVSLATSPDNPFCQPCNNDFFQFLGIVPLTHNIGVQCQAPAATHLTGFVFFDENENCQPDLGEDGLDDWTIEVVKVGTTDTFLIAATDFQNGQFAVAVDTGTYTLTITPPNYLFLPCQFIQTVTVGVGGAPTVYFPLMPLATCPKLRVDVGTAGLRPCFETIYFVNYCNDGTGTAADAFVEITFPPSLTVTASEIPGLELPGNVWQFQLGDLPKDTCGSFSINTFLSCADSVGQTYCMEAHIFPDSICGPQSPQWDGSSVELSAECVGDSVVLTIANAGWGDMAQALEFIVVEDNVLIRDSTFQLPAGASTSLAVYPNGATIVLSSQQAANHPGMSMPIIFVEGCGADSISLGFVTQYPQNDADCFVAVDCRESVASFDPNIKEAQPKGVTEAHYIESTTDLTYQITFQNLGTAAAETVVILDTLSQFLDTARLQLGAASHPYKFEMVSPDVLKITFENIQLPHAAADFEHSIGFVKFRITQKPGNTPGTVIENRAGIYFDFNAPVITNTVTHRIPAPELFASQTVTLCPGESWQGLTLTSDTVLVDTVRYAFFDSIFSTHLQVLPVATGLLTETLCPDESITVNGTLYNEANPTGTELLPGASMNGCDSLVHVALAFWPTAASEFSATVCEGTIYPFQDTLLSQSGTYEAHLTTVNGCDSLVTLHLEVLPVYEEEVQVELSAGGSYHGITVFQDTVFTVVLEAANGCDSVVTVTVDILTKTVEGAALLDHLSVSPNPNRGDFVLRGQLRTGSYCKARLLDAWGREVTSLFVEQWFVGDFTWPVQVDNLPSGLYYLEFSTTEGRTIRRMAVMR